jgi:hypothetical protein
MIKKEKKRISKMTKLGRPVDVERREKAVWANNTITVLPFAQAQGIVSCLAFGKVDDAKRQITVAVLKARRKEALALARDLAGLIERNPWVRKFFAAPFPAPTEAETQTEVWIEMARGLLDLEEMMNPQVISTSAYRAVVEKEVPQLANPKNAKEKDELKQERDAIKTAAREIAEPFEKARAERKKRIRGEVDEPVVGKKGARKKKLR